MKKCVMNIVKYFTVFMLFTLVSFAVKSQTLTFCEDVDDDGNAIESGSSFFIPSDGGYIWFLVNLPYEVNCKQVHFSIYALDDYGKENFDNTVYQDVKTNWVWFSKKVTFYHTGDYNVYVYDDKYNQLTKGTVRIKM